MRGATISRKTAPIPNRPEDWVIARRKGNRVRYQNRKTAAMTPWEYAKETKARTDVAPVVEPVAEVSPRTVAEIESVSADYTSMSRDQLREIAKVRKVKGRGSMSKAELVAALSI